LSDSPRRNRRPEGAEAPASGAKRPDLSQKFATGFALMSVVPILLAVYLMSREDGPVQLLGVHGLIVLLMLASAIAGFSFIRRELARTFLSILDAASQSASGSLQERIRDASQDEIGKISETIRTITRRLEEQSSEAERTKDRLRGGITRVAQAIQTSRNGTSLLEFLAQGAIEAVDGRTAYLVGVDEEAGDFVTRSAVGDGAEELTDRRVPLGEGIPGLAARERRPVLLHDLDEVEAPTAGHGLSRLPETTIAVPLFHGDTLHGVLIVHDRRSGGKFTDDDLSVVANLTTLISAALGQQEVQRHLEDSLDSVLRMFSQTIEGRDPYARGHSARVARYCEEMAKSLRLDEDTIRTLRRAALLHDIGKIAVPETVLKKEGRFTEEELEHVRTHAAHAESLLKSVPQLAPVGPMIRHHHERCDGSGYPDGLKGDDIPLTTHILIVANAFDVMTSDRSYRKAMSLAEAFETLKSNAGRHWDRRAVHALMSLDPKVLKATGDVVSAKEAVKGQGTASISVKE
jgi:putative nucleotidyltransferase with HDIG domain